MSCADGKWEAYEWRSIVEREPKWNSDAKLEVERDLPLPAHLEKRKAVPSRVETGNRCENGYH